MSSPSTLSHTKDPTLSDQSRQELDKRLFHLKTLFDLSRDLSGLSSPRKISRAFLLSIMGLHGFSRGFILLTDRSTGTGEIESRGLSPEEIQLLETNTPRIITDLVPNLGKLPSLLFLRDTDKTGDLLLPGRMDLAVNFEVDKRFSGFLGLGELISEECFPQKETDFVLTMTGTLATSLNRAVTEESVRQLNHDLALKNEDLEASLIRMQEAQTDLDCRLFHLSSLYSSAKELQGLNDPQPILESFLLSVMGVFSLRQSGILISDRREKTIFSGLRGTDKKHVDIDFFGAEEILYRCFGTMQRKDLSPSSLQSLSDLAPVKDAFPNIPARNAFLFVVDESTIGLLVLGDRLNGAILTQEEIDLLRNMSGTFMSVLKNALAFATIQRLNLSLSEKNVELEKTIAELLSAQDRIALLETAKARIRSMLARENQRIERFSLRDALIIFFLGLALGILFNLASPNRMAMVPQTLLHPIDQRVLAREAKILLDQGNAVVIDARPTEFFEQQHIAQAVNLPQNLFDFVYGMKKQLLETNATLLVYGRTRSMHYDEDVARRLIELGYRDVRLLQGNTAEWTKAGISMEPQ